MGVIAGIGGVGFAFLISKKLNIETEQKRMLNSLKKELEKFKKIRNEIKIVGINDQCLDYRIYDILKKYYKDIKGDDVIKKCQFINYGCLYLNLEEVNERFLEYKKEEIFEQLIKLTKKELIDIMSFLNFSHFNYFEKLNETQRHQIYTYILKRVNIDELEKPFNEINKEKLLDFGKKEILESILESKIEYDNKIIKDKINSEENSSIGSKNIAPIRAIKNHNDFYNHKKEKTLDEDIEYLEKSLNYKEIIEKEAQTTRLLWDFKESDLLLDNTIEELNFLKEEEQKIKNFLRTIVIFFLVGTIYPLSYIKYGNIELDYTLKDMGSELNSESGFFLLILTAFIIFVYKYISKENNIEVKEISEGAKKNREETKESSWIIKRYYEFKVLKNLVIEEGKE